MQYDSIFELIHLMEQATNRMIVSWLKRSKSGLGISHILVLNELRDHGESIPSDIARSLGFTPASLTHLTSKLVKQQLILRRIDENDRRKLYLSITEQGLQVLEQAQKDGQELKMEWLSHLTEKEIEQLLSIYKKLEKVN